jgi:hypothetical protein
MNGQRGDIFTAECDAPFIGRNQADHEVEASGFSCAIGSEEPNNLARVYRH